jgi:release factor glutamine methyltransferase
VSKDNLNSIFSVFKNARNALQDSSDSPALDAELLLAHCLGKNQTYLHTWPDKLLNTQQSSCFSRFIEKRKTDYHVAYMLGHKEFWTLDLIVTEDVLIPRPETELLVETALEKIKHINKPKILDLGTGSGAIALALASERPDAQITASDFSLQALDIAKKNAIKNQLSRNLTFTQSNWLDNIAERNFDLILSNPPYINPTDPHLLETIRFEPRSALVAKNKGLSDIKMIIQQAKSHLKQGGFLIIEHGFDQAEQVLKLFQKNSFNNEKNQRDLNKNPRVSYAQN